MSESQLKETRHSRHTNSYEDSLKDFNKPLKNKKIHPTLKNKKTHPTLKIHTTKII